MENILDVFARTEPLVQSSIVDNPMSVLSDAKVSLAVGVASSDDKVFISNADTALQSILSVIHSAHIEALMKDPTIKHDVFVNALCACGDVFMATVNRITGVNIAGAIYDERINGVCIKLINKYIDCYTMALQFDNDNDVIKASVSELYISLAHTVDKTSVDDALSYAKRALNYHPDDYITHFTLGELYNKKGEIELALVHFKLCVALSEKRILADNYRRAWFLSQTQIAVIYKNAKQYNTSMCYLKTALKLDDKQPDVLNTLGAIYNELVMTDLAEPCFRVAIENAEKTYMPMPDFLVSVNMNLGRMHFINGDIEHSIECNIRASMIGKPSKAYQNALFYSINNFLELEDKMDIRRSHEKINSFYDDIRSAQTKPYVFDRVNKKIHIGIVSSDFRDHVVFNFISSYLVAFDDTEFELTCYLESPSINISRPNATKIHYKSIDVMSDKAVADLIYMDGIDVLVDLNGNTGDNRLGVFSLRPAPAQVSYLGYPYSTGLAEMDYRITDLHCDDRYVSQPFYSEQLVFVQDSFLCFNPSIQAEWVVPVIRPAPFSRSREFLTIGCFGRMDKMSVSAVGFYSDILTRNEKVLFVFKSIGLKNLVVRGRFLARFPDTVRSRVRFLEYSTSYKDHLASYNEVDVSIDTFPYSGTTTCCDSLLMGTAMFSLRDEEHYFHAHNVSSSILRNTHVDMEFFVLREKENIHAKLCDLQGRPDVFWENTVEDVRAKFLDSVMCDKARYAKNMGDAFKYIYKDTERRLEDKK